MHRTKISIKPDFCIVAVLFLFMVPISLLASWVMAVFVHELAHYIALVILRVRVYRVTLGYNGAMMETEAMSPFCEIISSLAGPFGGMCLLFVCRWFPYTAIFALMQSAFNLLPIYPLDGGRILHCCAVRLLKGNASVFCRIVKWITVVVLCVIVIKVFSGNIILIAAALTLLVKDKGIKFPCKQCDWIVQ